MTVDVRVAACARNKLPVSECLLFGLEPTVLTQGVHGPALQPIEIARAGRVSMVAWQRKRPRW